MEFKEQVIFEIEKDKPIDNAKKFKSYLKKKYKGMDIRNLYIKIANYQIETYGEYLNSRIDYASPDEMMIRNRRINQMNRYWRNK